MCMGSTRCCSLKCWPCHRCGEALGWALHFHQLPLKRGTSEFLRETATAIISDLGTETRCAAGSEPVAGSENGAQTDPSVYVPIQEAMILHILSSKGWKPAENAITVRRIVMPNNVPYLHDVHNVIVSGWPQDKLCHTANRN